MENPNVIVAFSPKHAPEMMTKRHIDAFDVRRILKTGTVETIDIGREETWNVRGKDSEGRTVIVVCVVYEELVRVKVVTAFPR